MCVCVCVCVCVYMHASQPLCVCIWVCVCVYLVSGMGWGMSGCLVSLCSVCACPVPASCAVAPASACALPVSQEPSSCPQAPDDLALILQDPASPLLAENFLLDGAVSPPSPSWHVPLLLACGFLLSRWWPLMACEDRSQV